MKKILAVTLLLAVTFSANSYENSHVDAAMKNTVETSCNVMKTLQENPVKKSVGDNLVEAGKLMNVYYELYIEPYKESESKTLKREFDDLVIFGMGYYYGAKNCEIILK